MKYVVVNDVWETYSLNFSVFQPFVDTNSFDMRLDGNIKELDRKLMHKREDTINWMPSKYGQKIRPYEVTVTMKQENRENKDLVTSPKKTIEYLYSMKNFKSQEVVFEREPYRVLEIQDPIFYRGTLAHKESSFVTNSHKAFIVNGKIDKADGNFEGGFIFNWIQDHNVILGTYPLSMNDVHRIKEAGVTAVLNIQTGPQMNARGIKWDRICSKYRDVGIYNCVSHPILDEDEDEYIEELFHAAQHLNDLIEQGNVVYVYDNTSTSRAPTLILTYLTLFMKCKNYDYLPDAQNEVIMSHEISTPNTKIVAKLLKKHHKFQDRIKLKWTGEADIDDRRQRFQDNHYLSKNYRKNIENQKFKRHEKISDVDMEAERRYLFT